MSRIVIALTACLAYAAALHVAVTQSRTERAQRQALAAAALAHCEAPVLQMSDVKTLTSGASSTACACATPDGQGENRGSTVLAAVRAVVR